jgi:hypothetical protein
MEADWSVEIGGDAPVIETDWPGWIDLAVDISRIAQLDEVQNFPPLGEAIMELNRANGSFQTTKCDLWFSDETVDPFEFDSEPGEHRTTANCYLDLLPQLLSQWACLAPAESWARYVVDTLRAAPCRSARAEIVLRQVPKQSSIGATLYVNACGSTPELARKALIPALQLAVSILCSAHPNTLPDATKANDSRITIKAESPAGE